jgi:hypothetical protein
MVKLLQVAIGVRHEVHDGAGVEDILPAVSVIKLLVLVTLKTVGFYMQ